MDIHSHLSHTTLCQSFESILQPSNSGSGGRHCRGLTLARAESGVRGLQASLPCHSLLLQWKGLRALALGRDVWLLSQRTLMIHLALQLSIRTCAKAQRLKKDNPFLQE